MGTEIFFGKSEIRLDTKLPDGLSGQYRDDGGKRARSPGSAKETVKTIACGNAG